jgi:hypothetical protein
LGGFDFERKTNGYVFRCVLLCGVAVLLLCVVCGVAVMEKTLEARTLFSTYYRTSLLLFYKFRG